MPVGQGWLITDRAEATGLTVTNTPNTAFCPINSFTLTAQITSPGGVPPGNITFVTWHNGTPTTQGTGAINPGTGIASYVVPASTFASGQTYYIQATYPGSGEFQPQSTPANTSGVAILPNTSLTTSTAITPVSPFCVYNSEPFTVTVTATGVGTPNPTDGTVSIWIQGDSGFFQATTTGGTLSGSNSTVVTVTGGLNYQWFNVGTNYLYAVYNGDGTCYGTSQSPTLAVTTTVNTPTIAAPLKAGGTPGSFCSGSGSSYNWTALVTDPGAPGTLTGTFRLNSTASGPAVASVTTSVSTGTNVTFTSVPDSSFNTGSQDVYVSFTPTSTTGCYGFVNGTPSGTFSVVNSNTQVPSVSLTIGTSPSGPFGTSISITDVYTIYCQIQVNESGFIGNGSTSIDLRTGTIHGNYPSLVTPTAPSIINIIDVPNTIIIVNDQGNALSQNGGNIDFSGSYFGNVNQTFYMVATYNGDGCYGYSVSNEVTINVSQQAL